MCSILRLSLTPWIATTSGTSCFSPRTTVLSGPGFHKLNNGCLDNCIRQAKGYCRQTPQHLRTLSRSTRLLSVLRPRLLPMPRTPALWATWRSPAAAATASLPSPPSSHLSATSQSTVGVPWDTPSHPPWATPLSVSQ